MSLEKHLEEKFLTTADFINYYALIMHDSDDEEDVTFRHSVEKRYKDNDIYALFQEEENERKRRRCENSPQLPNYTADPDQFDIGE